VSCFLKQEEAGNYIPWRFFESSEAQYGFKVKSEFSLPSKKRIDVLLCSKRERLFCALEFKIFADVSALTQVIEYAREMRSSVGVRSKIKFGSVGIVAQYFHPDLLKLANYYGIFLVHFIPTNKSNFCFSVLTYPSREDLVSFDKKIGVYIV
jgi:hypothetical protein